MKPHTTAKVAKLPPCDFCSTDHSPILASIDGKTIHGPWANMCDECFETHGVGLGLGRGQRLEVAE